MSSSNTVSHKRTFKELLGMFHEDKLTKQTLENNIRKEEREVFVRKLRKHPKKYLGERELSQNQDDLLNHIYIMRCKSIIETRFHDNFDPSRCSDCRLGEKRSKFLDYSHNTDNKKECAVCISPIDKNETICILICAHHFHKECIHKWLNCKLTCPCCRCNFKKYME